MLHFKQGAFAHTITYIIHMHVSRLHLRRYDAMDKNCGEMKYLKL